MSVTMNGNILNHVQKSAEHARDASDKAAMVSQEIAESNLRVALIGELVKARKERGLSQKQLEELTGVKQPVIARMENGSTTPNLSTILKVLAPLGKTLYIGDLKEV